jgi:hypothetical protein
MGNGEFGGITAAARTKPWLALSVVLVGWAFVTLTVLHLVSSHNPLLDTLSSYYYTDHGTGMLSEGMAAMALGSLALLFALRSAGVPLGRPTGALFTAWSGGLTAAAFFPASYPEHPDELSGVIHQYSCVTAFVSMPLIGFTISGKVTGEARRMLRRRSWWSAGVLALFGLGYLLPGLPLLPVGVTQRGALIADLVLLIGLMTLASAGGRDRGFGPVPEKPRQTAGVQEHDVLAGLDFSPGGAPHQRGGGLAVVHRLQHDPFGTAEKPERVPHLVGGHAVTRAERAVVDTDVIERRRVDAH